MTDRDAVKDVMSRLTPEGMALLKEVLLIEKKNLHIKNADVTDDVLNVVKGLVS